MHTVTVMLGERYTGNVIPGEVHPGTVFLGTIRYVLVLAFLLF